MRITNPGTGHYETRTAIPISHSGFEPNFIKLSVAFGGPQVRKNMHRHNLDSHASNSIVFKVQLSMNMAEHLKIQALSKYLKDIFYSRFRLKENTWIPSVTYLKIQDYIDCKSGFITNPVIQATYGLSFVLRLWYCVEDSVRQKSWPNGGQNFKDGCSKN